jgi:parallel beta-helix repeat protein
MQSVSPAGSSSAPSGGSWPRLRRYRRRAGATLAVGIVGGIAWSAVDLAGQPPPSPPSQVQLLPDPAPDPSWVSIYPGTKIQQVVDAYPGATTFYLRAGVHRRQTIAPKDDNIFVGEQGAVLDGENVASHAFETVTRSARRVRIKHIVIQQYASPRQLGAIQGDNGTNWVLEDSVIRDNLVVGVRIGPGWQVRRNRVHHNGVIGLSGYKADGAVIEANDIYENNYLQAPERPVMAEASGIKFGATANLVIRGNNVHHNFAKGIWVDHCNPTSVIEGNTVAANSDQGIFAEISYNVIIRNNISEDNGLSGRASWLTRAGIQVTNSPNVEIYGNIVRDNANGITAIQSSGGAVTSGPYGPLRVENLNVHDNTVHMRVGKTGLVQNTGETQVYTIWNNRFHRNTYYLGANAAYFAWGEKMLNESQWQATGNDTTGRFIR